MFGCLFFFGMCFGVVWFQFFFLQSWGWFGFSECSNNPLQVLFGSSRIGTIFKLKKIRYKRIFFGKGYSLEKDILWKRIL